MREFQDLDIMMFFRNTANSGVSDQGSKHRRYTRKALGKPPLPG
jgi:hypothetical protein